MRFLRVRRGEVESVWTPEERQAAAKAAALRVLKGSVVLVAHPYAADPHSGAGNCWCARAQYDRLHDLEQKVTQGRQA